MRTEKHTPGPWEVTGFADCQLITKDQPPLIGRPIPIGRTYGANQIADARLIAAAPDMLAALKDAQEEIRAWRRWAKPGEGPDKPAVTSFVLDKIASAIAKAEGAA